MRALPIPFYLLALSSSLFIAGCETSQAKEQEGHHEEVHRIVATSPVAKDVITTQEYVCQIHSRRHIEVRALENGYLEEVHVQEGQAVKKGDVMFRIVPVLYQASLDTERAEAQLAQIKYDNTKTLADKSIVSQQELAISGAELAKAQAKVKRARAELNFTGLTAPFDGIVDRQMQQQGSLVEEGDILSTLSDNQLMWVYFNVPEARYLEYKSEMDGQEHKLDVELRLANGKIFQQPGEIGAIEADFDNETGNIPFRADFPNPEGLLRHGQTGTILIHKKVPNAIVIPQRATYEILAKKYVYVIVPESKEQAKSAAKAEAHGEKSEHGAKQGAAKDGGEKKASADSKNRGFGVVRQREIHIVEETDDLYVVEGLKPDEKIVFEGVRQVRDGQHVEYDFESPQDILKNLKFHAE